LLKGREVINDFSKADTVIFDKTGTLTIGKPEVAEKEFYGENIDASLGFLASVERESDHPLAQAVINEIRETKISNVEKTEVVKGEGIIASVAGHRIAVGNVALMERENAMLSKQASEDIKRCEENGNSVGVASVDGELTILMGIRNQIHNGIKKKQQNRKK